MVERIKAGAGDAALEVVSRDPEKTYKDIVGSKIDPHTYIRTDGLPRNSLLHGLGLGLDMTPIKKKYGPMDNVDRVISLAKRYLLGTYHQYCSRAHLQKFLNEYTFRFNRRYKWCQLTSRTLTACVFSPPVPYAAIS